MGRIVVVASMVVGRAELEQFVRPEDELILVVPAVEQSRLQWLANDEDRARATAGGIGAAIDERAPTDAAVVEIKPDPPRQVVEDAIAAHRPDRVVVAVREGSDATWLEEGELDRIPSVIDGTPVIRLAV